MGRKKIPDPRDAITYSEKVGTFRDICKVKRERFVYKLMLCGSIKDAAEYAGYSRQYGYQMMKQKIVTDMIQHQLEAWSKERDAMIAGAEEVMVFLTKVLRGELGATMDNIAAAQELGERLGVKQTTDKIIATWRSRIDEIDIFN